MQGQITKTAALAAVFTALYVCLYRLSGIISGNEAFGGFASLFFLPAFVRLLAFLIIGYWSIPALFVAALFCVDLGLGPDGRIVVSAFLAVGAPLGIAVAMQMVELDLSLSNLTPSRLLWLSMGSALGNAVAYQTGLSIVGFETHGLLERAVTFIGDTAGTWTIIYILKASLTIIGRSLSR